jgi:hypothetical protein
MNDKIENIYKFIKKDIHITKQKLKEADKKIIKQDIEITKYENKIKEIHLEYSYLHKRKVLKDITLKNKKLEEENLNLKEHLESLLTMIEDINSTVNIN